LRQIISRLVRITKGIFKALYMLVAGMVGLVRNIYSDPHLEGWFTWKVFFPLMILVSFWPIYGVFLHDAHSFLRAFAHGDLLIFSGLILIEAAIESKYTQRGSRELPKAIGAVFIFVFGLVKYHAILKEQDMKSVEPSVVMGAVGDLLVPSCFNCAVTIFSVAVTIYIVSQTLDKKKTLTLEVLQEGPKAGLGG
jgi:hypothetical protein